MSSWGPALALGTPMPPTVAGASAIDPKNIPTQRFIATLPAKAAAGTGAPCKVKEYPESSTAQQHGRNWIGIDVTYLSVDLIRKRLHVDHAPAPGVTVPTIPFSSVPA